MIANPKIISGINLFVFLLAAVIAWSLLSAEPDFPKVINSKVASFEAIENKDNTSLNLYEECNLEGKIKFEIFKRALDGLQTYTPDKNQIMSVIDFSQPSTKKRFFIIDLKNKELLFQTFVAHGKNSGINIPTRFSNKRGSLQSSLGFFRTAETYFGKHGYSLMLDGLEKGINDNARKRAIVIHGAKYVSKDFINNYNRLGRSWGCPAVSEELSEKIIDIIKGGTCLFIYSDKNDYLKKSIAFNSSNESHIQAN